MKKYLGAALVVTFALLNVLSPRPASAQLTDPPPVGGTRTPGASLHASPHVPIWLSPWRSWAIQERDVVRFEAATWLFSARPRPAAVRDRSR